MKSIGTIIRNMRAGLGYSQDYVATLLGIGQAAYSKIESGETDVTISRLYKLAEIFKVSIYEMIPPNEIAASSNSSNNDYELSVTIKLTDKAKEKEILRLLGLNNM